MNGFPDDLGNHVVGAGDADGGEPEAEGVVAIPPVDDRLDGALDGPEDEHDVCDAIEPWKPEEGAEEVPLGDVDVSRAALAEHEQSPYGDEGVGGEEDEGGVGGKLQPLDRGAVPREDRDGADGDPDVPERGGGEQDSRVTERGAAEAGHKPDRDADGGGGGPAIGDGVEVGGADTAKGEPGVIREEQGVRELD